MNKLATDAVGGDDDRHRQASRRAARPDERHLLRNEVAALRRQNAMLRETLDTIEGSVVVYDPERRYLFANLAYRAIFPYLPADDDLVGRKYEEILALSI